MHSENESTNQELTFIERARRKQIIEATIEVLAAHGYLNTSFARIAKAAGISPSLISYHFKDKQQLTLATLLTIFEERFSYVASQAHHARTATDKIRTIIEADIANMGTQPKRFKAATEIIFSMRSDAGTMAFLGDTETPLFTLVRETLESGKKSGEFGEFDVYNLALIIEGARDSFLGQLGTRPHFELQAFTESLLTTIMHAIKKGA